MSARKFLPLLSLIPLLLLPGCDGSSGSDFVREVGVNVAGLYAGANGADLVSNTSGDPVTQLNIRQSGSELTGIDNNGNLYRGDITQVSDNSAGFILRGNASNGAEVTMNGAFNVAGDTSTMTGRWIEPTVLASINGTSFVPGRSDTDGDGDDGTTNPVAVSPAGNQTLEAGETQTFTATGGDGTFTWTLADNTIGSLNTTTGATVTYSASAAGSQTITSSSDTESTSVTITQTAADDGTDGTTALAVTPAGAQTITIPDNINFNATGGDGTYTWSISDGNIGTLSDTTGSAVTYVGTGTGNQTLTVQSDGNVVTRQITQSADTATNPLSITPSGIGGTVVVGAGVSQAFTVAGGTAPYSWTLSNTALGSLDTTQGTSVTFTAGNTPGAPTLTVSDADGQTATVILGLTGDGNIVTPPTP